MDRGFLIAAAAAAGVAYLVYSQEKKDDKTGLQNSFQNTSKPIPPAPGAYECPNQPGMFVLPGYMWKGFDGIVVSSDEIPQYDSNSSPISFSNGFSYWFRQGITDDFLKTCPAPQ